MVFLTIFQKSPDFFPNTL